MNPVLRRAPSRLAAALLLAALAPVVRAAEVTVVLTNDTHSFLGSHGSRGRFGGYARVATIIDEIRASTPNVLVVDGGDWVEGTFFFRLNEPAATDPLAWPGTADLHLKELMGYDCVVIGNHDIIDYNRTYHNGNPPPTTVIDRIVRAGTLGYPILAYNFDPALLPALDPLVVNEGDAQPFATFDVNGVRVAVGGVTTDLFVYQMYLTDGAITAPDAARVQGLLDAMNATSPDLTLLLNHVGLLSDADLARTTSGVDVVVGGHSHHFLLQQQTETGLGGDPVQIVQAGSRGMFVGRLDLEIDDATKAVTVTAYTLIPVDRNVPEKASIAAEVASLQAKVVAKNGPVFTDAVATMDVDVAASSWESSVGNLLVDAVLAKAAGAPWNADLAFISNGVVSNPGNTGSSEVQVLSLDGLRRGPVHSEDAYRIFGNGYNPVADANYRIFVVDLLGSEIRFIQELFNFGDLVRTIPAALFVNMAGGEIVHDPQLPNMARIVSFDVGGAPIVDGQTYSLAVDEGALQLVDYLVDAGLLPFDYTNKRATGIEVWTAVRDYLAAASPVGAGAVDVEGRYRTVQADLGVFNYDVTLPATWQPGDVVPIGVTVRNLGNTASSTATLEAYLDLTPFDWSDDPRFDATTLVGSASVAAIGPFPATSSVTIPWDTTGAPPGEYPIYLKLTTAAGEPIATNQLAFAYTEGFVVPWRLVGGPGAGPANPPRVRVLAGLGAPFVQADFAAYGATGYGTHVATGDVDAVPDAEVLTGPGPGAVYGPQLRGFRLDGTALAKLNAYAYGTLKYGVNVAGGDPDGDGLSELLTGAGPGDVFGPHVRLWNFDGGPLTPVQKVSFFAYQTPRFGVVVATGDLDRDGFSELLTGPGPSPAFGAQVRGFDYDGSAVVPLAKVNFVAFPTTFGARVASGDVEGDGFDEILAGAGPGPTVTAQLRGFDWDGGTVTAIPAINLVTFAAWRYGTRPGAGDVDADAIAEILATPGPDPAADARARGYDHDGGPTAAIPGLDLLLFEGLGFGADAAVGALAP